MKCFFCKKEIPDDSLYCCHCGKKQDASGAARWYHQKSVLITAFFVIGPFVLFMVWTHPTYSKNKKIGITIAVLCVTFLLILALVPMVLVIVRYYQLMSPCGF